MPLSAERGLACWEGSAGIQPICCSSISPVLPVPSSAGRGNSLVCPAAPFPLPVEEQREAGRQSSGSRWASPAACQPSRLPTLWLSAPALSSCSAAGAWLISPAPSPTPAELFGVTSILSPRHGASGKVLRGDLLTTDPPQQQSSAAPGSGSLISFILFFCYYCLHLSFIPTPIPSAGSSCPPASSGSRNQTPPGPDAISLHRQRSSCSQPCQRRQRGLAHGEPHKPLILSPVATLTDPRAASRMVA